MKSKTYGDIHRIKYDKRVKAPRKTAETRAMLGARFKILLADAGLSVDQAAKLLHVTPRTIQYWVSGRVGVPYSAYKLVRVMRWFELPQPGFEGWCLHSGKLWTPEGFPIGPEDGSWWSLLVRQARCFRTLYQRSADFERALMMLGAKGLTACDQGRAAAEPSGPAQPALDLSLRHFGTSQQQNAGSSPVRTGVSSSIGVDSDANRQHRLRRPGGKPLGVANAAR